MRLGNLKLIEGWLEKKYATANPLDYNEKAILIECLAAVKNTPTIEAKPVQHGRWVKRTGMMPPEFHGKHGCSLCGRFALSRQIGREELSNYCPYCGAKMDLKE